MTKLFGILTISVIIAACNSNDKQPEIPGNVVSEAAPDSMTSGNELNENTIAKLDNTAVFKFTKSNAGRQFNWKTFQLARFWKEDSLMTSNFEPPAGYFDNYGSFLKYSPDSSMFIDLDSYNISIQTNQKGERIGQPQGPDTEVNLIDVKKAKSSRLIFLGPGNNIEDASWLDNENLVLVSSADNDEGKPNASLIKYNLPSKTFFVYETTDTALVSTLKGYWKKERLKGVIIR